MALSSMARELSGTNSPGVFWATAPNRHLVPFLEAGRRLGLLDAAYYGRARLAATHQIGTPPGLDAQGRDAVLPPDRMERRKIDALVARTPARFHVLYGYGPLLTRPAMRACRRAGFPFFLMVESLQPRKRWDPRRWVRDGLYRSAHKGLAGAFALSRNAARDLHRLGVPRDRIFPALYPGPRLVPSRAARERRIVYCGRLLALKGLEELREALLVLKARGVEFSFDVIGDGPLAGFEAPLRARGIPGRSHGAVASERVPGLLSGAGALVLPTRRREGWGYVVNEAYAAGVPVVTSDVVGAQEIVIPGKSGHVFRSGDVRGMADALEATLSLEPSVIASAVATLLASFDPDRFARYVRDCIEAALSGGCAPAPPWHSAIRDLGGNACVAWWDGWLSGNLE